MEENTQVPKDSIIPADKIVFMKEVIEKLRKANRSDYDAGEFDSYNHKNEGRYKAFEEVLQWVNPVAIYEEKMKVLTYDNNKLKGQVEGLTNAVDELKGQPGARWVKGSERLPQSHEALYIKIKKGKSIGSWHPHHEMFVDDAGDFHPADQVEWLDESAAGRESDAEAFAKYLDEQRSSITPDMWHEKVVWESPNAFQQWLKYFKQQKESNG